MKTKINFITILLWIQKKEKKMSKTVTIGIIVIMVAMTSGENTDLARIFTNMKEG
jgi:hypothetical protein